MPSLHRAAAPAKLPTRASLADLARLAGAASLGAGLCAGAIVVSPAAMNGIVSLTTMLATAIPGPTARPDRARCERQAWPYNDTGCLRGGSNPRQQQQGSVRIISTDRTSSFVVANGEGFAARNRPDRITPSDPPTVWTADEAEARPAPVQDNKVVFAQVAVDHGQRAEPAAVLAREQPRRDGTRPRISPPVASPQAPTQPSVSPTNMASAPVVMWRKVRLAGTPDQTAAGQRRPAASQATAARDPNPTRHRPIYDVADGRRATGTLRPRNDRVDGPLAYAEPLRQRRMTLDSALDAYFSPLNR